MSGIRELRGSVRRARELVAAARMVGDSEARSEAEYDLEQFQKALALALVSQAKEKKRGVSKADEPGRKPAKLP